MNWRIILFLLTNWPTFVHCHKNVKILFMSKMSKSPTDTMSSTTLNSDYKTFTEFVSLNKINKINIKFHNGKSFFKVSCKTRTNLSKIG